MLHVAIKMLVGDRAKYAGLVFGITFTSFLVTFAASYFAGFMTRGFALVSENPTVDVWVMDPAVRSVGDGVGEVGAAAVDQLDRQLAAVLGDLALEVTSQGFYVDGHRRAARALDARRAMAHRCVSDGPS